MNNMQSSFQPVSKHEIREMSAGFSLCCTEQKSKSTSPTRTIFRAKRRGNNNINNNDDNLIKENDIFENMTQEQYMGYQQQSMSKRMKRKRKFDVFSSGSNMSLNEILQNAKTFRVPHYAMFYVRINAQIIMQENNNNNNTDNNDTINNIFYPTKEECLITRSIRVSSEWVAAYNSFETAHNIAWKQLNPNGKIHEYQINGLHGIILLNLDEMRNNKLNNTLNLTDNEQDIQRWVLDHGYSGFIMNACFHFVKPYLYWNLLDDNKQLKVKQTLISDMFQSTISKPRHSSWKPTFT